MNKWDIEQNFINNIDNFPANKTIKADEQEQLFFLRVGSLIRKWKIDGGLSLQLDKAIAYHKRYNDNNLDTVIMVNKTFANLLPSITISFTIDSTKEVKFTYDRSVMPPYHEQFVNFINRQDPQNWTTGNPGLTTETYNNLYLGFTHSNEKVNINSDIF